MRFLTHAFAKFSYVHISGMDMKAGSEKLFQFWLLTSRNVHQQDWLYNEGQNCEEALKNASNPQVLKVILTRILPEILTCSQDQEHSQEYTSRLH